MQNNSINSQTDIANVTVVTEENQIIVPQPITNVVEVNTPGPQGSVGPQGVAGPSEPFANVGGGVYATTSSIQVSGSFLVSGSSTFTNIGPAIFSGSANIVGATTMSSAIVTGNVTVLGTASINTLLINQTILSTGSNQLGDSANDTQTLYGTVVVPTGSLTVSGNVSFGTSSAGFFWDNTNSRLGIGTSSPSQALTITNGGIALGDSYPVRWGTSNLLYGTTSGLDITNTAFAVRFRFTTGGNLLIGTTSDPGARLYISGSTSQALLVVSSSNGPALFVSGSGNVGIGTITPTNTLDVNGSARILNGSAQLLVNNATYSELAYGTTNYFRANGASAIVNGPIIQFLVGGSEKVRVASTTGNFLINTTTDAGFKLDVNGNAKIKGSGATSATTALRVENTNTSASLVVLDNGYVGIGTSSAQYQLDVYGTYHQYQAQGGIARYDISSANANQNRGVWDFYTNAAVSPDFFGRFGFKFEGGTADSFKQFQVHVADSTTPKFVVNGSGNVGIGTIAPSASLHITGSSNSGLLEIDSPAVNNIIYVSGSGFVGVGTNNPIYKLDVSNPTGYSAIGIQTAASTNAEINFQNAGYSLPRWTIRASAAADGASGNLTFQRLANTFPMTITSGDNVLIGTSTDSARLMVKGSGATSATTALRVENTNASASLVVLDNGYVGIGTASAAYNLDVNGTARVQGNLSQGSGQSIISLGNALNLRSNLAGGSGYILDVQSFNTLNSANNEQGFGNFLGTYAPTSVSGTPSFNALNIAFTINQTGGANGITRGIYLNPTLTSFTDFRAIENVRGNNLLNSTSGNTYVGLSTNSGTARLQVRGSGATSATTTLIVQNSTPTNIITVLDNGQVSFTSPTMSLAASQSAFSISPIISASNIVGGQYYGVSITPTFFQTTGSQTETAFRVAATFTQSSATATGGTNIIADFGSTSAGSQLTVTDVTSGSIYMVNDVSGIPIIEATSNWDVNMYDFPNKVFEKTGSQVNIYGTMRVSGSFILPLSQSVAPQTGSAYWSGSFLFIYDGTRYRSSSFA
jgi:hypothetical protein